jgi:NAD(P)-dependent dehydrogenase (short-subunit alcohol dehydrogenase family)
MRVTFNARLKLGAPKRASGASQAAVSQQKQSMPRFAATKEAVANFSNQVPMKRPGQPAELATAYVMLADPLSSYASGATIAATAHTFESIIPLDHGCLLT